MDSVLLGYLFLRLFLLFLLPGGGNGGGDGAPYVFFARELEGWCPVSRREGASVYHQLPAVGTGYFVLLFSR